MKVVLLENVAGLGQAGEVKEVAHGFGRNFLLPRRLATLATPQARQQAASLEQAELRRQTSKEAELDELAGKLQEISLSIKVKAGVEGKLYGAVTSARVARELARQGIEVDRRNIVLPQPMRQVGSYPVVIRLRHDLAPELTVVIEGE